MSETRPLPVNPTAASHQRPRAVEAELRALALDLGFHALGITTPDAIGPAGERLRRFLAEGCHGDMGWLQRNAERRAAPSAMWPPVRSIVMLGISYAPQSDPLAVLAHPSRGAISCYAQGRDYHDVVKRGLVILARRLAEITGADARVFVDTAPLMEKPLAAAAGLGWQGKHTNLVSRTAGSWLFLGAILTDAELQPDAPEIDHCGRCRRCLDICPTEAFPAPYRLDARRCIAYLTIEHRGHIPHEMRRPIGNRVFGCDDCLAVCPWNKFAAAASEQRFHARDETRDPPLEELLSLDDAAFRKRFSGTPVKRTGRDRVVRNALIAAGNSGSADLAPHVTRLLDDASPLVRAMDVWAARRLLSAEDTERLCRHHIADETNENVLMEWARPDL
jgi:epoxyqueuosine reductase